MLKVLFRVLSIKRDLLLIVYSLLFLMSILFSDIFINTFLFLNLTTIQCYFAKYKQKGELRNIKWLRWESIRYILYFAIVGSYIKYLNLISIPEINEKIVLAIAMFSAILVLYYLFKLSILIYDEIKTKIHTELKYLLVLLSVFVFFPFGVWYLQKYFNQLYDLEVQGQLRDSEN